MFKWIARKLRDASAELDREKYGDHEAIAINKGSPNKLVAADDHDDDPIRFELTSAVGGRILRVRRYDRRNHESDAQVYVIPQGEDVGERVSKIINLELLK